MRRLGTSHRIIGTPSLWQWWSHPRYSCISRLPLVPRAAISSVFTGHRNSFQQRVKDVFGTNSWQISRRSFSTGAGGFINLERLSGLRYGLNSSHTEVASPCTGKQTV